MRRFLTFFQRSQDSTPAALFKLLVVMIASVSLAVFLGQDRGSTAAVYAQGGEVRVDIRDFAFAPSSITVPQGTTVTWTNFDSVEHSSTADGGLWDSMLLNPGGTFSFTFNTPGVFAYHCGPHPFMRGSITVTAETSRPPGPGLISPPNGTSMPDLSAPLMWTPDPAATQFHVQVIPAVSPSGGQPDGPGINLIISDAAQVAAARYDVQAPTFGQGPYVMLPGMTYSWHVRTSTATTAIGEDDPSWSEWSETWTFRTRGASSATIGAVAPAEDGTTSSRPALQWSDSDPRIFYYEVQLSADPQFRTGSDSVASVFWNLVHGGESNPRRSWTVPANFALAPGQYFWRVRPRIQGDGTPVAWSNTFSFKVPVGMG